MASAVNEKAPEKRDRSKSPQPRQQSRSRSRTPPRQRTDETSPRREKDKTKPRSPRRETIEAKLRHLDHERCVADTKRQEGVDTAQKLLNILKEDQQKAWSDASKDIDALEKGLRQYKTMDMVEEMLAIIKTKPDTAFVIDTGKDDWFGYEGPGEPLTVDDGAPALVKEAAKLLNAHFKVADADVYHVISATCSPCSDDYAESFEAEYEGEEVKFKNEDGKTKWVVDHKTAHRNEVEDDDSDDLGEYAEIVESDFSGCGLDYMTCRKNVDDEDTCVLIPRL